MAAQSVNTENSYKFTETYLMQKYVIYVMYKKIKIKNLALRGPSKKAAENRKENEVEQYILLDL